MSVIDLLTSVINPETEIKTETEMEKMFKTEISLLRSCSLSRQSGIASVHQSDISTFH